jgi:hypothetical protein
VNILAQFRLDGKMKAIISGGRDFSDKTHLETTLKYCLKWWNLSLIITGGEYDYDLCLDCLKKSIELLENAK